MIVLLFIYLSAAYWFFRRYPRHIFINAFRLLLLILFIIPTIFLLMLVQTPLLQIGGKISGLFGIKEEDIFSMALSVLFFLLSALLMHFSFDYFHMAYSYLELKLVFTSLFFVALVEFFSKKRVL